jgi:hypothetical protein
MIDFSQTTEVHYSDQAINWMWYGACLVRGNLLAVQPDKSYRLHKYDESQGAGKHPKHPWSLDTYNGGNVYGGDFYGASLRHPDGSNMHYILCDIVDGQWVQRPLADWVIESRAKRKAGSS